MQLSHKEVASGFHNDKVVWICDYRYNDYGEKPIRRLKPTRVIIRDIDETKDRIYYSDSFFSKLNKNDEPLKAIIKLFDNTGYRSFAGVPLSVFTTEEECATHYVKQLETIRDGMESWLYRVQTSGQARLHEVVVETLKYQGIL